MAKKSMFSQVFSKNSEIFEISCSDEMYRKADSMSFAAKHGDTLEIEISRHNQPFVKFYLKADTESCAGFEYLEIQNSWQGYITENGSDASIQVPTSSADDYIKAVADSSDIHDFASEVGTIYSSAVHDLMLFRAAEITQAWQNDRRIAAQLDSNTTSHLYQQNAYGVSVPKGYFRDLLVNTGRPVWAGSVAAKLHPGSFLDVHSLHSTEGSLLMGTSEPMEAAAQLPEFSYSFVPLGFSFEMKEDFNGEHLLFSVWEQNSSENAHQYISSDEIEERLEDF